MKDVIRNCLCKEAETLFSLVENVDDKYVQIASLFAQCKGKLVFTGVGKSFLVGKKIASSFTSLGIKSIALDPLSMLHGDIGLLAKEDILVCLSKSGETDVLLDLVLYIKKSGIPIVSILGTFRSSIYKESDYCIVVECKEAGPFGIVPTTSATAMMVIGDALLCAVVNLRGITLADLKKNHPGGAIGKNIKSGV